MQKKMLLVAALSTLTATSAMASVWVGDVSNDWNNAANWDSDPANPSGDFIINNTAGPGIYPVISATPGFTPVDIRIGTAGGTGRVDQVGGTVGTGNGNWFFLGYVGSNATYNLADTAAGGGTYTGFGTGSGNLNIGGALQNGNFLIGLDNGTVSTLNVNTSGTLAAGGIFLGAVGTSSGNMNVDAGTVNVAGELQVGANFFAQGMGTSNYKQSGGTVTSDIFVMVRGANNASTMVANATVTGGVLNTKRYFTLGFAASASSNATFNLSGGTVNVNTAGGGNMEMAVFDPTKNTFNLNSGALNLMNNAGILYGAGGNHSGVSTINQNGGTVTFYSDNGVTVGGTGLINLGNGGSTGTETYNLNGGVLIVPSITKTAAGATGIFNFNGGQLHPTAATTTFLQGLTRANVRNGGATIVANADITIAQALVHSNISGDNAKDGGLLKMGNNILTLTGVNTYTGDTLILGGGINLSDNAALSFVIGASGINNKVLGAAVFNIDGDFLLDLTGAATTVGSSWNLVDAASLAEVYGATFSIPGFTESSNVWTADVSGARYQFSESTGILQVVAIPEPASLALLGMGAIAVRRSRKA